MDIKPVPVVTPTTPLRRVDQDHPAPDGKRRERRNGKQRNEAEVDEHDSTNASIDTYA